MHNIPAVISFACYNSLNPLHHHCHIRRGTDFPACSNAFVRRVCAIDVSPKVVVLGMENVYCMTALCVCVCQKAATCRNQSARHNYWRPNFDLIRTTWLRCCGGWWDDLIRFAKSDHRSPHHQGTTSPSLVIESIMYDVSPRLGTKQDVCTRDAMRYQPLMRDGWGD